MLDYQLSPRELELIEQTQLVATERFMLRITLSVWRILLYIGSCYRTPVEYLTPEQIVEWMIKDAEVRHTQGGEFAYLKWHSNLPDLEFPDLQDDLVTDTPLTTNEKFLTRMLISALPFLKKLAEKYGAEIGNLRPEDIVQAVEHDRTALAWQN